MKKVFAQSVRDAILSIDPEDGQVASRVPNHARRTLLRNDLAEIRDGDEDGLRFGVDRVFLTKVGLAMREILVEMQKLAEICDRMRESGLNGFLSLTSRPNPPAPARSSGANSCRGDNPSHFATFIDALNASGRNRWKDPRYMGEGPVHVRNQPARKEQ